MATKIICSCSLGWPNIVPQLSAYCTVVCQKFDSVRHAVVVPMYGMVWIVN